jgi:hypothetical protein
MVIVFEPGPASAYQALLARELVAANRQDLDLAAEPGMQPEAAGLEPATWLRQVVCPAAQAADSPLRLAAPGFPILDRRPR